jgi:Ca2+-binding RTX toxin-like protein
MTTVTGAGFSIDMRGIEIAENDIDETDVTTLSDTEFTVDEGETILIYGGTGFADNNADDIPDTGTITSYEVRPGGNLALSLTDFSMSWEDYWGFVDTGDDEGWLNAMFSGDDTFNGSTANDFLFALAGHDTMLGGGGKDTLDGGKGKDDLDGGAGRDKLIGGKGTDTLTGGGGGDSFVFHKIDWSVPGPAHDIIVDFSAEEGDFIDLRKMNNGTFHLGGETFDGEVGEIIDPDDGLGNTLVQIDVGGDGIADFEIMLWDVPGIAPVSYEI